MHDFVHKHMQYADFGAIFIPTCMYKTLRNIRTDGPDLVIKFGVKRCGNDLKEKSHKVSSARFAALHEAIARYLTEGGVLGPPPPPVF